MPAFVAPTVVCSPVMPGLRGEVTSGTPNVSSRGRAMTTNSRNEGLMSIGENPLISCILPVYNAELYLRECINSILCQTYQNFELVIINDGSTDNSARIISEYREQDPRVRSFDQPNSGIVAALNTGLSAAKGQFIARMDADDVSLPKRFELQLDYLRRHNDVVLVGGQSITIDAQGTVRGPDPKQRRISPAAKRTQTDFGTFPLKVATALHPLVMMRAEAIKAIGGYRADYRHVEDYDMYIRISRYGKLHNISDVVLKYRLHGGNISVKHTSEQERNAARSEIDNLNVVQKGDGKRKLRISDRTFDGYVELRTFRREIALNVLDYPRAVRSLKLILSGAPQSNVRATIRLLAIWFCNNARYWRRALAHAS